MSIFLNANHTLQTACRSAHIAHTILAATHSVYSMCTYRSAILLCSVCKRLITTFLLHGDLLRAFEWLVAHNF
jgi:hypothetical protein